MRGEREREGEACNDCPLSMPTTLTVRRQKQWDLKFKASLSYLDSVSKQTEIKRHQNLTTGLYYPNA